MWFKLEVFHYVISPPDIVSKSFKHHLYCCIVPASHYTPFITVFEEKVTHQKSVGRLTAIIKRPRGVWVTLVAEQIKHWTYSTRAESLVFQNVWISDSVNEIITIYGEKWVWKQFVQRSFYNNWQLTTTRSAHPTSSRNILCGLWKFSLFRLFTIV